jgi:hypothetical protein
VRVVCAILFSIKISPIIVSQDYLSKSLASEMSFFGYYEFYVNGIRFIFGYEEGSRLRALEIDKLEWEQFTYIL